MSKEKIKINQIINEMSTKTNPPKRINIKSFIKSLLIAFTLYMIFYIIVLYIVYWK